MAWITLPGCLPDNNRRCIFCYLVLFQKQDPKLSGNNHRRNKQLAKTLFVVTLFSLITWLPFVVVFSTHTIIPNNNVISPIYRCLQLANSFFNPIIYCFRMPIFRETLRASFLIKKKKKKNLREGTQGLLTSRSRFFSHFLLLKRISQ